MFTYQTTVMKNYKLIAIALFAAFSFATTGKALANGDVKPKSGIELRFIGNIENQPVFQLSVNGTEEDEYFVTFRDEQNNVVYTGKLKGASFNKNFQLSNEASENAMSVEVRSKKTGKAEVYQINKTRSVTEEIVVNKL